MLLGHFWAAKGVATAYSAASVAILVAQIHAVGRHGLIQIRDLASLVPLVGSSLIWVPAAFVLLAHDRAGAALFLTFWGLVVVSLVDNIVKPLVVSGRAQISTLPVLLGLIGGLATFGAIGIILGPVVIALALAFFRFAEEEHAA